MNENHALELFEDELNSIRMPDLWEKVYSKVQSIPDIRQSPEQRPRGFSKIYAFAGLAAFVLLAAVSTIFLVNMSVSIRDEQSTSFYSETVSDVIPIKSVQPHSFSLSAKTNDELELMLGSVSANDMIYEDSAYIYRFDENGILCGMADPESGNCIDLEKTARLLIGNHFPEATVNSFAVTLDNSGEHPALCIKADITQNGLSITEIKITFCTDEWRKLLGIESDRSDQHSMEVSE